MNVSAVSLPHDHDHHGDPHGHHGHLTLQYQHDGALTLYVSAKNLFDRLYIGDLSRGIVAGPPRLLQAGFEYRY